MSHASSPAASPSSVAALTGWSAEDWRRSARAVLSPGGLSWVALGLSIGLLYREPIGYAFLHGKVNPSQSHATVVPLISILMVWIRRDQIPSSLGKPNLLGIPLLAAAFALHSLGILSEEDNCPLTPNGPLAGTCTAGSADILARPCMEDNECGLNGFCSMAQEDTYPPGDDGIGDACFLCEADLDCDRDVDGSDAATFKEDFGRSLFNRRCIAGDPCNGDFTCDGDVDGSDATAFKQDFGRSQFQNPCPQYEAGEWCVYP